MDLIPKVMCIECHQEVGLGRLKWCPLRSGQWLCPTCKRKLDDGISPLLPSIFQDIEGIRAKAAKVEAKKAVARNVSGVATVPVAGPAPLPTCPAPVNPVAPVDPSQPQCPKCLSYQTTYNRQGFSAGKAVAGLLLAPGGVLWGFHGKNKIVITCMKCGYQWTVGK